MRKHIKPTALLALACTVCATTIAIVTWMKASWTREVRLIVHEETSAQLTPLNANVGRAHDMAVAAHQRLDDHVRRQH